MWFRKKQIKATKHGPYITLIDHVHSSSIKVLFDDTWIADVTIGRPGHRENVGKLLDAVAHAARLSMKLELLANVKQAIGRTNP